MLKLSSFQQIIQSNKVIKRAVVLTWACNTKFVFKTFRKLKLANNATILVYYQKQAYSKANLPQKQKLEKQQQFCQFKGTRNESIYFFRCKPEYVRFFQLHAKCVIIEYTDNSVSYFQLSWNLTREAERTPSLVYVGVPYNLDILVKYFKYQRFQDMFTPICSDDPESTMKTVKKLYASVRNVLTKETQTIDYLSTVIVTLPEFPFDNVATELESSVQEVLRENVSQNNLTFSDYVKNPTPAVIVATYSFVDIRLLDSVCDVVGNTFSLIEEDPVPTITTGYARTYEDNAQKVHEKFVYKLSGFSDHTEAQIQWLFFCSHNLTPASWRPIQGDASGEFVDISRTKNLEVGLMMFTPKQGRSPWSSVEKYLLSYYYQETKFVKFHQVHCQMKKRTSGETKLPQKLILHKRPPQEAPPIPDVCTTTPSTAWDTYLDRKACLISNLLQSVVGASDLLSLPAFNEDNYTKYALYEYVFIDIAGDIVWKTNGIYNYDSLRGHFTERLKKQKPAWYTNVSTNHLGIETLIYIFITWGKCFELFDPQILVTKPRISKLTLVDYQSIVYSKDDTPFLLDPSRLVQERDSSKTLDPYDSLAFLIQHLNDKYETWWVCPKHKHHKFYWEVSSMFTKPECKVCVTSPEVQRIYSELCELKVQGAIIDNITVEFPVLKRESYDRQKKELKKFENDTVTPLGRLINKQPNSLLGIGDPSEKDKLQNIRYDVFFTIKVGSNYQFVAIEADDPSHREIKSKGNTPKVVHSQDAVKNLISYLLQVHVLRIWTPNASGITVIPAVVSQFVEYVKKSTCKMYKSFDEMHAKQLSFLKKKENQTIEVVDLSNPKIDNDKLVPNYAKPLSCIVNTSTNESKTFFEYVEGGMTHEAFNSTPLDPLSYVDVFSVYYNFYNFERFKLSKQGNPIETFWKPRKGGLLGKGCIFDHREQGGLHVVYNYDTKTRKVTSFNMKNILKWNQEIYQYQDIPLSLFNPLRLVRLVKNIKLGTVPVRRGALRSSTKLTSKLESWIKENKWIFVVDDDDQDRGKRVKISKIRFSVYGLPYIYIDNKDNFFNRSYVGPDEIQERVYKTQSKKEKSNFKPTLAAS